MSLDKLIEEGNKFEVPQQVIDDRVTDTQKFVDKFPLENLVNLKLEEFVQGTDENSFCYWLEFKKIGFGIGGGNASKFGIYKTLHDNKPTYATKFGKNKEYLDEQAAQKYYSELINTILKALELTKSNEIEKIKDLDIPMFNTVIQKILFMYYPEKFLSIGKASTLIDCAGELGIKNISLDPKNSIQINHECKKTLDSIAPFKDWNYEKTGLFIWDLFFTRKKENDNLFNSFIKNIDPILNSQGFKTLNLKASNRYVWLSGPKNIIGTKTAHYEIIQLKKDLFIELHFEDKANQNLFKERIEELPNEIEWFDWDRSESLRFKKSFPINENSSKAEIVDSLKEFDQLIGDQVRNILSEEKQYWLYAPGENAKLWDEFYQEGIMGLGWDEIGDVSQYKSREEIKNALADAYGGTGSKKNDVSANDNFLNKINIGDVIIVKKGRGELLGYGVVTSDYLFDKNRKNYQKTREVDWKLKGNWNVDFSLVLKTLTDITKYNSDDTKYDTYYEQLLGIMGVTQPQKNKEMKTNHPLNTILYGPPGTGKTYNTVKMAAEIVAGHEISDYNEAKAIFKDKLHDQIEFITFHQNYSYEDFIQGLRPATDNQSTLTFDKKDGVFKSIADRALDNLNVSKKAPSEISKEAKFEKALESFKDHIEDLEENYFINETAYIFDIENDAFRYTGENWNNHTNGLRMKFSDLREFYLNNVQSRKEVKTLINVSGLAKQHATYYFLVYQEILKYLPKQSITVQAIPRKNYIIIIDEINRANISRVFGELITLIEPDKRSEGEIPMEVKLPSGDTFMVPSNLYIIGTMNTADKSIALLDIALRRRFEFKSMYPQYEIENHIIHHKKVLQTINKEIISSKGHDFQIGHAYFMGESDLKTIMNNKVIPLLLEYYMNDKNEVSGILQIAGLKIEDDSWPLRITGKND